MSQIHKCGSSRKLVILFIFNSCYSVRARGIVSVVSLLSQMKSSEVGSSGVVQYFS